MFSPAIVNVLCFDPDPEDKQHTHTHRKSNRRTKANTHPQNHGADQARGYAGKYCAKPEASHPAVSHCLCLVLATHVFRASGVLCIALKQCRSELFLNAWYFMESEKNGVKSWLKALTIGLCATFNRLLGYHPVRSTRPVIFFSSMFIRDTEHSNKRTEYHLTKYPDYPNPVFYLGHLGKYYFRSDALLHLRIEQVSVFVLFVVFCWSSPDATAHPLIAEKKGNNNTRSPVQPLPHAVGRGGFAAI